MQSQDSSEYRVQYLCIDYFSMKAAQVLRTRKLSFLSAVLTDVLSIRQAK